MPATTFSSFAFAALTLPFLQAAPAGSAADPASAPAPVISAAASQPSSGGKPDLPALKSLAAQGAADDFYLKTSGISADSLDAASRKELAALMLSVAQAKGTDRVIAFELAERSIRLQPTLPALILAADLAAALGESAAAIKHLDQAKALAPNDENVTLRRAALALHLRDWETAQTLYASIPASSPLAAQAKAGLAEVEKARRANDDDEAVERAHRDLLKRMAATDAMIDAMPVSRFDLCRAHTLAACEALAACKKTEPNCAYLLNDCPMSEEPVSLKRTQLGECAEILSTLPCEGKEREIAKLASSVCKGIQLRTSRQLLPEGANSADKARQENKNSPSLDGVGINPQDVDRVIRQLGGGQ